MIQPNLLARWAILAYTRPAGSLRIRWRSREQTVSEHEPYNSAPVPIIWVFRVRGKHGCQGALAHKLATSSIEIGQGQPGFLSRPIASPASESQHEYIFVSIGANAEAVKTRFGEEWRVSLLPPGYVELIEECSGEHYHLTAHGSVANRLSTQFAAFRASAAARRTNGIQDKRPCPEYHNAASSAGRRAPKIAGRLNRKDKNTSRR